MRQFNIIRGSDKCLGSEIEKIDGKEIMVEGIRAFKHKAIETDLAFLSLNGSIVVSEYTTGMTMGRGFTEEAALDDAEAKVRRYGLEDAKKRMSHAIKKYGVVNK